MPFWIKLSTDFDDDPKVIAAGYDGAAVFAFLLRMNGRHRCDGKIPSGMIAVPFVARKLNAGVDAIERGINACVGAGLIRLDPYGNALIPGWRNWAPGARPERCSTPAPENVPMPAPITKDIQITEIQKEKDLNLPVTQESQKPKQPTQAEQRAELIRLLADTTQPEFLRSGWQRMLDALGAGSQAEQPTQQVLDGLSKRLELVR